MEDYYTIIYSIILYDAVAGGAGHVRRLVTDDCGVFQRVVRKAISITKNCNCSPSCYNCLRNYYNQQVHDLLDRQEAFAFLETFVGKAEIIPDDEFEVIRRALPEDIITEEQLEIYESWPCDKNNWTEFKIMIPDEAQEYFEDFDYYKVPLPSEAYCKSRILGMDYETEILFLWKAQKIMVFENDKRKLKISGWTTLNVSEIRAKQFANLCHKDIDE